MPQRSLRILNLNLFGGISIGIILSGLKLIKPAFDFCLQTAKKVDTRTLQKEMEELIYDCFIVLKPLASQLTTVSRVTSSYGTTEILIGEWVRDKSGYQKLGSLVDREPAFFNCIRRYGEQMKPLVRRTIRREFSELVDLAKQLKSYNDLTVKVNIPPTRVYEHVCICGKGVEIKTKVISTIGIETQHPLKILLFEEGKTYDEGWQIPTVELTAEAYTPTFEDIISYLVDLYKKADAEVSVVREHNQKIMAQISEIVAPMKIANSLKG